jgi:hypothetical protein
MAAEQAISISANIATACTISSAQNTQQALSYNAGNGTFSAAGLTPASITASCNGASTVSLRSQNGGLTNNAAYDCQNGGQCTYTGGKIDYQAAITNPGAGTVALTLNTQGCVAGGQGPGCSVPVGPNVPFGAPGGFTNGIATVTISNPSVAGGGSLGAGSYADVLTVQIMPGN